MAADQGDLPVTFSYSMPRVDYLTCLPMHIHVLIARYLPLRDQMSYSRVNACISHAVYYVFEHAMCLDFTSVLCGNDRDMGLDAVYFLHMLECHPRATTLKNFKLPIGFNQFDDLFTYMEQNWRENVHRKVGNPNGQLARIEFDQSSWYGGSEDGLEGQYLVYMLQYYDYVNEDGTASIGYNTKPDDTCVVPAWSEADIATPKATAIKDWYVYLPDDPRCKSEEILQDPCQECLEGDCTDCVFRKPLILRLDLSVDPGNSM